MRGVDYSIAQKERRRRTQRSVFGEESTAKHVQPQMMGMHDSRERTTNQVPTENETGGYDQ
jgi:hypothetical protein